MKSAALCTLLLSLHAAQAHGRTPFGGPFQRPGWRSSSAASTRSRSTPFGSINTALVLFPRGGDDDDASGSAVAEDVAAAATTTDESSLDDRVEAAMRRLGLEDPPSPPPPPETPPPSEEGAMNCEDGVCTLPEETVASAEEDADAEVGTADVAEAEEAGPTAEEDAPAAAADADAVSDVTAEEEAAGGPSPTTEEDIYELAASISTELSVPQDIVLAAIYSSFAGTPDAPQIDEAAARSMVQSEIDAIANVEEDCDEVMTLVEEGFDAFFARRSLAFSGMDIDNARAILMADREDEEAEREEAERAEAAARAAEEPVMPTVTVDFPKNFDPLASAATAAAPTPKKPEGAPKPAKKEDVVFEGTTEDLQKLVIESPVPVLLDVYADWCGPCKQLTPALEQITVNAGGMLRLVKINTDMQRQISGALEVKALPTIFGIKNGRIMNMFQGMPRDEQAVRDFLMGLLVPGQGFKPPVTDEEQKTYDDLSGKLVKLAAGASFSFSAREQLQSRVGKLLDLLVESIGGETGMAVADDSARTLRSLLSNVIAHPFEEKYRRIKLDNKVIAARVARHDPCVKILKGIGFAEDGDAALIVGKGKRVVNIAPFVVARDCIDKWIDTNRYHISAAGRKRKDETERARLAKEAEEAALNAVDESEEEESEEEADDDGACTLKLRLEGKKKVHDVDMDAEDTLSALLARLPFRVADGETVRFTCAAKRLVVQSDDAAKMSQTLTQLRLAPSASVVVKIGDGTSTGAAAARGGLAERAASSKKRSTGSHSMHSIGLYAKDDGNKAETFESGGVLYDHVLTDDESEEGEEEVEDGAEEDDEEGVDSESDEGESDEDAEAA